jgi:hypothetical protein
MKLTLMLTSPPNSVGLARLFRLDESHP